MSQLINLQGFRKLPDEKELLTNCSKSVAKQLKSLKPQEIKWTA